MLLGSIAKDGVLSQLDKGAIWAPSPTTTRGQPTPLSADSKGQRIAYAVGTSYLTSIIELHKSDG